MVLHRTSIRQLSQQHQVTGLCGPAVKLLMIHYGIDEKNVNRSGPKQNILKSDILSYISSKGLRPVVVDVAPPATPVSTAKTLVQPQKTIGSVRNMEKYVDIPLTSIRSTIAKRLTLSKQTIPHEYASINVKADILLELRARLKKEGIVLSLNDFIVKAAAVALRSVPEVNVRWSEEQGVQLLDSVDISVAVATPTGLITPIVSGADMIGVQQISSRIKGLAERAKDGKLQPNEYQGGSFTISNLGMFGSVSSFTAIINPPQAAILTVGGSRTVINGNLEPETKFTLTLCFDGRAIDVNSARRFLEHLENCLSDPDLMMVEPFDPALDFDFARLL